MAEDGLVHATPGHCPLASQVGEVEVTTPLLKEKLHGHVYIAEPECGGTGQEPCTPADASNGKLFGIYLEVAGAGVIVKLKGKVSVNPETGQIGTSFEEDPQLPFSELKLKLNGGPTAPLANSQTCGNFEATTDLTSWAAPQVPDANPTSSFPIDSPNGGACGSEGFSPAFTAGTVTPTAGTYSPFTLSFSRRDGEQDLSGLTVNMPEGLIGKIAGTLQCGNAEVAAAEAGTGTCPAASKVGTATAGAGAGSDPFYQSGPVYLTGPYNGAPFGLAVVVPANAGPYHLGNIVVRAAIHINPVTAAVSVTSNPLPQMIDGVPLRLKTVNVTVGNESNFTFNATSCNQQSIGATITSAQGASVATSSPYQAQGCASLPFDPSFTASTQGNGTTKGHGASLDVKIEAKQGPGYKSGEEEANLKKVDVSLPLALSSRLTTLQKACTEKQFAANPADCPAGSAVGTAKAVSPLLNVPLEGPAYLVSHGGAAFPDLDVILQGEGVTIVLTGGTQIKNGITYSKFETAPDAPISSFELKIPEKENALLGAIKNLCAPTKTETVKEKVKVKVKGREKIEVRKVSKQVPEPLIMPTSITAQNGRTFTQGTRITVTGCPKVPAKGKAAAKKKKGKGKGTGKK
jgi:hypothetical protein